MREERKAESAQLEAWSGCLDDVAQSIACIADGMELTWSDLTGWPGQATQYLFHHALAALRSAPAEAAEPVDARLESLWRQLALDGPARLRPEVAGAVRTLWPDAAHQQAYGHALVHLARLLAAGGCAWAARCAPALGCEPLARWAQRAAELFGETAAGLDAGLLPADPARSIDHALPAAAAARLYAHWCLSPPAAGPVSPSTVTVKVAGCVGHQRGVLFDLHLTDLPGGDGVVAHPEVALRPTDDAFREALARAWQAARRAAGDARERLGLVWRLEPLGGAAAAEPLLRGSSLGAAAHAGCLALIEGWRPDPDWLLLGRIADDGGAAAVEDIAPKLTAARTHGLRGAVVMGSHGYRERFATPAFSVVEGIDDLRSGCDALRSATTQLAEYLRRVADLDEVLARMQGEAPVYLQGRSLRELYIEPLVEVLAPQDLASWALAADQERFSLDPYESRHRPASTLVSWTRAADGLAQAVLLGQPGEGKTLLGLRLVGQVATEALAALEAGRSGSRSTPLPVFLRLADVAAAGSLRAALGAALSPWPEVARLAADALDDSRLWLVLDGLDEVDAPKRLQAALAELGAAPRVLVTSRPLGASPAGLGRTFRQGYRLAPLSPDQRQTFLARWFPDDEGSRKRVDTLIASNAQFDDMTRNGLLLTLTCWVLDRHRLEAGSARRADLYRLVLDEMVRQPRRPDDRDGRVALDEARLLLSPLAWALFRRNPARRVFAYREVREALAEVCGAAATHLQPLELWDILTRRGLWVRSGVQQWLPVHRTFHEYAAAEHVASRPADEMLATVAQYLWQPHPCGLERWEPAAAEFLSFVAGCLDEPAPLLEQVLGGDDPQRDAHGRPMLVLAGRMGSDARPTPATERVLETVSEALIRTVAATGVATAAGLRHEQGSRMIARALREGMGSFSGMEDKHPVWFITETADASRSHRHPAVVEALLFIAGSPIRKVRQSAAYALANHVEPRVTRTLVDLLENDWEAPVRQGAAEALGQHPGDDVTDALFAALSDEHLRVRVAAAEALSQRREPEELRRLLRTLVEPDIDRSTAALSALARHVDREAVEAMAAELLDACPELRLAAAQALARRPETAAAAPEREAATPELTQPSAPTRPVEPLLAALEDESPDARWAAVRELGDHGGDTVRDALLAALDDADERVRIEAALALGTHAGDAVAEALRRACADTVPGVRLSAIQSLFHHPSPATVQALRAVVFDGDHRATQAAGEVARRLLNEGWRIEYDNPFMLQMTRWPLRRKLLFRLLEALWGQYSIGRGSWRPRWRR